MKEKRSIKHITTLLAIAGTALLLLLSPCKVRNSIEVSLGLKTTEVANKSKATLQLSSCVWHSNIVSEAAAVSAFKQLIEGWAHLHGASACVVMPRFVNRSIQTEDVLMAAHPVPLYILFRNFKAYL
ncbi:MULTISPECIES: hypothetical protein [unclassified Carboxylicivirga]|uniref:hypothetical protein n=1 Tax=Carboxylicivirga TaxID=1628153 RepID=UPI003D32878A